MPGGLRYETGRDMPPGMLEKAAVQIARNMTQAVPVPAAPTPELKQLQQLIPPDEVRQMIKAPKERGRMTSTNKQVDIDHVKEKLIELIRSFQDTHNTVAPDRTGLADYLIASGFIEELQNEAYDLGVDSASHNHFGLSWEDAAGLRKEIKQLQDAVRWISVEERLPQEDLPFGALCEVVQVLLNDGSVTIGWCNRGLRCWFHMPIQQTKMVGHEYENTPVIAWQSLAQPPKGERKKREICTD